MILASKSLLSPDSGFVKTQMTFMKKLLLYVAIAVLLVPGCRKSTQRPDQFEIAISRALEQAIELSEKIISENDLIEHVALTEGTDAALALHDSIGHRNNINLLWEEVKQIEDFCNQVTDTLARKEIIAHLYPYAARLDELLDQIY